MSEIFVEDSGKIQFEKNDYYQSYFTITQNKLKTRITIFANQPVYYDNGEFELAPLEIRRQLCYPEFKIGEIMSHDLRDNGLLGKINQMLSHLKNV